MIKEAQKLKDNILSIAAQKNFDPLMVEKDHYSAVVIDNVHLLFGNRPFLLRGVTAISKAYLDHYRLSDDLDFALIQDGGLGTETLRLKAIASIQENMDVFLKKVQLKSHRPSGKASLNSRVFVLDIQYPSCLTGQEGNVRIDINLDHQALEGPTRRLIKNWGQDPCYLLVLSLDELIAEKLRSAIVREEPQIRDYYDLLYIAGSGFDFYQDKFIELFKLKILDYLYDRHYQKNFGLSAAQLTGLEQQQEQHLKPFIPVGEEFSLQKACARFNQILSNKKFRLGWGDYYKFYVLRQFEIGIGKLTGRADA